MEKEWTIERFLKTPPEGGLDYVAGRETWKNLFQCCFAGEKQIGRASCRERV